MGRPSRHIRHVHTRAGKRATLINDDVDPRVAPPKVSGRENAEMREAVAQLADSSGAQLKARFVAAIATQGERIANRSYGMMEVADAFAANRIDLPECVRRTRMVCVDMETAMATNEYAASRLSLDFQQDVAGALAGIRESNADALGYLLDMEDEAGGYGEKTAEGFIYAARRVFERSRDAALAIAAAAERETMSSAHT